MYRLYRLTDAYVKYQHNQKILDEIIYKRREEILLSRLSGRRSISNEIHSSIIKKDYCDLVLIFQTLDSENISGKVFGNLGDIKAVELYLESGHCKKPGEFYIFGSSYDDILLGASKYGHLDLVIYMIERGATAFQKALNDACDYQQDKIIEYLVNVMISKNIKINVLPLLKLGYDNIVLNIATKNIVKCDDMQYAANLLNNGAMIIQKHRKEFDKLRLNRQNHVLNILNQLKINDYDINISQIIMDYINYETVDIGLGSKLKNFWNTLWT